MLSVRAAFTDLVVLGDDDGGSFARFQAKANLYWVATDWTDDGLLNEILSHAEAVSGDLVEHTSAAALLPNIPTSRSLVPMAAADKGRWDWYENEYEAAFGRRPTARKLVARFRAGDDRLICTRTSIAAFALTISAGGWYDSPNHTWVVARDCSMALASRRAEIVYDPSRFGQAAFG